MLSMDADLEALWQQGRWDELGAPKGAVLQGVPRKKPKPPENRQPQSFATPRQQAAPMLPSLPTPAEQYQMSQASLGAAMDAIDKENYSRVSQNREMRRMAHEQELARIRANAEMTRANADRDTMLIRELLSGM